MLALHRTISLRYLRQRWSRALLVVASIALGVATLLATRSLNQSMHRATRGAVTPLPGFGDLLVSNGDHNVSGDLVDELSRARIPGIKDIQPLIIGRVVLPELENRSALVLGVRLPENSAQANPWGIEAKLTNPLALFSGEKPALIGIELARLLPQGKQDLRVRAAGKESVLAVTGTINATGPAASLGGSVVILQLADAARLLGRPGSVSRIDLSLEAGADRDLVRQSVETVLAGRAQVRLPEANDRMVRDVVGGIELGFALGGLGALVVGLFLVYNALAVSVAERRHDIGILRSVGATRLQIAGLFATEAGLLGFTGACLGIPLGMVLAEFSAGPMRRVLSDIFLPVETFRISLTFSNIVVATAAGILTALLAALVPAIQAAREEPAEAVRRIPLLAGWRMRSLQVAASTTLIAAGMACFLLRGLLAERVGTYVSVSLIFLGGLLATPLLAAAGARLLQPLVRSCLGIEGRLAADNLARSPGRTGLVIAALAAGTALLLETAGLTKSSEEAVLLWVDESFVSELVVTANSPIAAGGDSQEMDESLAQKIGSLPEVEAVVPVRFRRPFLGDTMIFLIAVDAPSYAKATRSRGIVPGLDMYPRLREPGTILASENFIARQGVAVGDTITLPGRRGPVALRVIGTLVDYSWNQGTLIIDREQYKASFEDSRVDAFDVFVKPGGNAEAVRETIRRRWGAENGLVVLTQERVRHEIADMIRRLYGIAYAQQVVVIVVAGLGVVTALLISVLQRRRELGLLRAVGASRLQVVRSLLAEAALMGFLGATIGVLLGIPLEWYAVRIILFEETGFAFPLCIPWTACASVVAGVLAVALAAGLIPALHAMRIRITEAIAYE
jgi:putative ABC transport system permease protein